MLEQQSQNAEQNDSREGYNVYSGSHSKASKKAP
jgi:hypothetical protein